MHGTPSSLRWSSGSGGGGAFSGRAAEGGVAVNSPNLIERRQELEMLVREVRQRNNVLIIGGEGVGKRSLVEVMAQRELVDGVRELSWLVASASASSFAGFLDTLEADIRGCSDNVLFIDRFDLLATLLNRPELVWDVNTDAARASRESFGEMSSEDLLALDSAAAGGGGGGSEREPPLGRWGDREDSAAVDVEHPERDGALPFSWRKVSPLVGLTPSSSSPATSLSNPQAAAAPLAIGGGGAGVGGGGIGGGGSAGAAAATGLSKSSSSLSLRHNVTSTTLDTIAAVHATPRIFRALKESVKAGRFVLVATCDEHEWERAVALPGLFTLMRIKSLDVEGTARVLWNKRRALETKYDVRLMDSALSTAAQLSERFMPLANLPKQAVDVMEAACEDARGSGAFISDAHVMRVVSQWTRISLERLATHSASSSSKRRLKPPQRGSGNMHNVERFKRVMSAQNLIDSRLSSPLSGLAQHMSSRAMMAEEEVFGDGNGGGGGDAAPPAAVGTVVVGSPELRPPLYI